MKNFIPILLISTLWLSQCNQKAENEQKLPELSKKEMAEFLADAHIAEAAIAIDKHYGDSMTQYAVDYYTYLIEKHGYNQQEVVESMEYYSRRPTELYEIYEIVNEILITKEGEKWE